jgi:hypothetical protein
MAFIARLRTEVRLMGSCMCIYCAAERGESVEIPTMLCSADDQPLGEIPDVPLARAAVGLIDGLRAEISRLTADLAAALIERDRAREERDIARAVADRRGW